MSDSVYRQEVLSMCLLSYKENKVSSGKMRMIGEGIKRRRNMAKALNNEKDVKKKKN